MKKGRLIAIATVMIVLVFIACNTMFIVNEQHSLQYLILLTIFPIVWWMGTNYDEIRNKLEDLKRIKKIQKKNSVY